MAHDEAYKKAEQKIADAGNHPRIKPFTNTRMSDHIRLFVKNSWTVLTPKGG